MEEGEQLFYPGRATQPLRRPDKRCQFYILQILHNLLKHDLQENVTSYQRVAYKAQSNLYNLSCTVFYKTDDDLVTM